MKTVFLFSGQGSQYPGMGAELASKFGSAKQILECGSDILGYDLLKKLTDSTPEELAQTRLSQPAIFTVSLLALNAVRENGIENQAVAGHSLGEYAAMYAAGMLTLEDAFKAIKLRSAAMAKAAEITHGAMAAVIGADADAIEDVCAGVHGYCVPANFNCPVQTVIAGDSNAVDEAVSAFTERKIRCVKLAVSAAFHTKHMESAAEEFKSQIADFKFEKPNCAFYSNLYGSEITDFPNMPDYLAAHICNPVKFTNELNAMNESGIEAYVELGPGKVLSGLVRKTLKPAVNTYVENSETLEKALAAL